MANMIHKWKDRDMKRALKALRQSGFNPVGVEIDPASGRIVVHMAEPESKTVGNPWDAEVEKLST